ncbi:MAG: redoxin domain-containing protein, partial [Thermoplasmata archaeon]|nr:redoxin domain-containing protein [Thermoplasmata archaeon]
MKSPDGSLLLAAEPSAQRLGAHADAPRAVAIGEVATGLPSLIGANGQTHNLSSFEGSEALVLAFLGDACPAVKACAESLVGLQLSLAPRRVQVIGVNPNNPYMSPRDTLTEMTRSAA